VPHIQNLKADAHSWNQIRDEYAKIKTEKKEQESMLERMAQSFVHIPSQSAPEVKPANSSDIRASSSSQPSSSPSSAVVSSVSKSASASTFTSNGDPDALSS
jgi:hypothetical protein